MKRAIAEARAAGVKRMTVEASLTARPLFERAGFSVIEQQTVRIGDQELTNFRMELKLPAAR